MRINFLRLLICLCLTFCSLFFPKESVAQTTSFSEGAYEVSYDGRTYDAQNNRTTFSYTLTTNDYYEGFELEHIVFEIPTCEENLVLDAELTTPFYELGIDPATDVNGIRWPGLQYEVSSASYQIVFVGEVPEGTINLSLKTYSCNNDQTFEQETCELNTIAGPACIVTPTCEIEKVTPLSCGIGGAAFTLDATIFNHEGDFATDWQTTCADAFFSDTSIDQNSNSTQIDFSTSEENESTSCLVSLNITSEQSEFGCKAEINLEACESCENTELGCPEEEVEIQTEDVSCTQSSNFIAQLQMDGAAANLHENVKRLAQILKNLGGSKRFANKLVTDSKEAYLDSWQKAWSLPSQTQNCNGVFCFDVSYTELVGQYDLNIQKLVDYVNAGVKRLAKVTGKKNAGNRFLLAAFAQQELSNKLSSSIVSTTSVCAPSTT